ncbi:hypothetical protein GCM10025882_23840 [Acinetobacter gyllenbergii]|uniref:Uncharacterized protein n=1 Tax=Acinetobacter gyllenbergii CIP 110306 = MTCC 11365 TaxID=1217657 RepID=A0A829HBN4_9GAMM|nr:hypothetical protein [Acinetobacter gyllenbergii]EPF70577.1 hypothetical protein F957_03977 [Acinetobacter gyllenbergii CIP 110306 = MTCC 11365]EPH32453.1 hypothetical protein L293_1546 [Acinetobacter gyllenbergii CIP 110306 = MTCC 11365]GMA11959.1 hypothetical protein GCM10025882_23840 [Acinetobacter gyllenbergii]
MVDESKKDQQMKNQNGRSVLVISAEDVKDAASASQTASDWLGYLTTGTKVVEKNNFAWGVLHSKNSPGFSLENLKKIKMYSHNPETNRVFQGNKHTKVTNIGKVAGKVDKVGGILGNVGDAAEIVVAIKQKDAKALASKSSTMILSKSGETAGLAAAGKCTKFAVKKLDPKRVAIAGTACYIAFNYGGKYVGDKVGTAVGETGPAVEVAKGIIKAIDIMDEQDKAAEEKRKAIETKKDPMLEWHVIGAD